MAAKKYLVLLPVASKYTLRHKYSEYLWIRSLHKIIDTYHIFGQASCKMAAIKVFKMFCVGLMCMNENVYLD